MTFFDPRAIKAIAKQKGVSQEEIAEACYAHRSTVSKWCNGKTTIPADVLPTIAKVLDCKIMDFYTDA